MEARAGCCSSVFEGWLTLLCLKAESRDRFLWAGKPDSEFFNLGGDGGFGEEGNRSLMSPTRPNAGLGAKSGVVGLIASVSSSDDRSMLKR